MIYKCIVSLMSLLCQFVCSLVTISLNPTELHFFKLSYFSYPTVSWEMQWFVIEDIHHLLLSSFDDLVSKSVAMPIIFLVIRFLSHFELVSQLLALLLYKLLDHHALSKPAVLGILWLTKDPSTLHFTQSGSGLFQFAIAFLLYLAFDHFDM